MVETRPAMPSEAHVLAALGLEAWCKGIKPLVPAATSGRIEKDNPFIPFLEEMGQKVLVATVEGQAAGIGACEHSDDHITDIWVSPKFEGRGVGSALIRALEFEILERGHSKARIHVAAANERALRLYQHLGYTQALRETAFDPILNMPLEKIGLEKHLTILR